MATTIKLKNGSGAPLASDLVQGEPAFDLTNKRLYTEDSGGTVIEVGTTPTSLTTTGTVTFGSLSDGAITITAFVDEDNMVSDSATLVPTQQSVKAYVDSQVTAQDLDFQGDSGGALSIDLDSETLTIAGGTGIDTTGATNTLTVAIDSTVTTLTGTQTLTNKTLTTPVISSISNTGTLTLPTSTDVLVGRDTTDTLTNKTLTSPVINTGVSGTAVLDDDTFATASATTLATSESIKAYVDAQVTASDLDFQADTGGALSIDLDSETITFTGGTGIDTSGSGNTVTFAIDSTVATLTGTESLTNKTLTSPVINTSVSGTAILDEDDMSSNSATQLATQQSIKAYVDSQVASADTLAELTDTNITTPADGALLFYDTTTSKWIDNVVSGDITIADTGVAAISSGVIVNDDINASAAISVSKTALTAGTGLTLTTDTLSVDASQTQITAVGTIGTGTWQGSVISDTYLANDLTISGGVIENTIIGAATPAAGTFTTFTSTGIDDNATSTAITIDASENVGIGNTETFQAGQSLSVGAGSSNSGVTIYSGTASQGRIYFGDTTTGAGQRAGQLYYDHSNDSMFIATGGDNPRVTVNSSGLVGIGTTDPSSVLHLSTSNDPKITLTDTGFGASADITGSNGNLRLNSQTATIFDMADSEVMRIDSSGNLALGATTSNNRKLSVTGSGDLMELRSTNAGSGGAQLDLIHNSASPADGDSVGIINFSNATAQFANITAKSSSVGSLYGELHFGTRNGGTYNFSNMVIDSSGNVGIGTDSPADELHINNDSANVNLRLTRNTATGARISGSDGALTPAIIFETIASSTATERMRIDSSGRVGIGIDTPSTASGNADNLVINENGNAGITIRTEAASGYTSVYFGDSASPTVGRIEYQHGGNDMLFYTSGSNAARIDSSGNLLVGQTNASTVVDGAYFRTNGSGFVATNTDCLMLNRQGTDGTVVDIRHANTTEGSISVSGTTVSYNGGHLSRWSQSDIDDVSAIYKGTVMSNLDEMCEWDNEDNEQLNKTKVSDVEGDVNVAGVFVAKDNSDDLSDYYLAMTGDMIIRIAQGTTVQRGDLLMSAGDGTAKPQDDDIVRSKTIAKVTSTNVTCTYADGSYCVPCVLMAC